MKDSKLSELRNNIDKIDQEILGLLAKRAEIVLTVGELKHKNGEKGHFIRSGREATMMRKLIKTGAGKFPTNTIFPMWRGIISASLSLENGLKIAIPSKLSFEQSRLITEYFGSPTNYVECRNATEVLEKIDAKTVGVLDISNAWWCKLAKDPINNIKVFAKLGKSLYAFATVQPEESGDDKTLVVSKGTKKLGKELASHHGLKLFEADGYITEIENGIVIGNYAKN
jgi:chorismate mutase